MNTDAGSGTINRQWRLAARPDGLPRAGDFQLVQEPVREPAQGEVRVQVHYLSMDPAPRLRMDAASRMGPALPLGSVMIGRGAGVVTASAAEGFSIGDVVTGELGWQEHSIVGAAQLTRIDAASVPMRAHLGLLASAGLTAYLTLIDCARAKAGETVVVAAAAGSVGLIACQLAKLRHCRVVALAHGPSQREFLVRHLALDEVIDDTEVSALQARLSAACPRGVDVFLDSVGGELHDAVMEHVAVAGRAILFGFISAYNSSGDAEPRYGRPLRVILRRAQLQGFLLGDHTARFPAVAAELAALHAGGQLQGFEAISHGFESVPSAFAEMFGRAQPGKHLVRLEVAID